MGGVISVFIFIVFVLLYYVGCLDGRIVLYFPFYFLGLLLPDSTTKWIKDHKCSVLLVVLCCLVFLSISDLAGLLMQYVSCLLGVPFVISISSLLALNDFMRKISAKVSFSSMMMYLFHRQFYLAAVLLFNISSFPNFHDAKISTGVAYFLVVPLIIVSCYYLQRLYDVISQKYV